MHHSGGFLGSKHKSRPAKGSQPDARTAPPKAQEQPAEPAQPIKTEIVETKVSCVQNEEILQKILEWRAEGFNLSGLDDIMDKDQATITAELGRIEKNIEEIRKIRGQTVNIQGVENEANALIQALSNPANMDEIRKRQKTLNDRIRARGIGESLDSMDTAGLEAEVQKIRDLLKDDSKLDQAEKEIKALKAKMQERFFLGQVKKEAKPVAPKKQTMVKLSSGAEIAKSTMSVEDMFLLYKDTRFISHHTRMTRDESQKQEVFKALKAIRDYIRHSGQYKPDALNKTPFGDKQVLIYGHDNLIVGLSITGTEPTWTGPVISRVFTMINEKHKEAIEKWDGQAKSLESLGQYIKVLMMTFAKLEGKTA